MRGEKLSLPLASMASRGRKAGGERSPRSYCRALLEFTLQRAGKCSCRVRTPKRELQQRPKTARAGAESHRRRPRPEGRGWSKGGWVPLRRRLGLRPGPQPGASAPASVPACWLPTSLYRAAGEILPGKAAGRTDEIVTLVLVQGYNRHVGLLKAKSQASIGENLSIDSPSRAIAERFSGSMPDSSSTDSRGADKNDCGGTERGSNKSPMSTPVSITVRTSFLAQHRLERLLRQPFSLGASPDFVRRGRSLFRGRSGETQRLWRLSERRSTASCRAETGSSRSPLA